MSKIIAVDFDGTLCENKYPKIGEPNLDLINYLKERQAAGDKVILWTCRRNVELYDAILWCCRNELYFDAVNRNLPETIKKFGGDTRKIFAHEYIDDRSVVDIPGVKIPFKVDEPEIPGWMVKNNIPYFGEQMDINDLPDPTDKELEEIGKET